MGDKRKQIYRSSGRWLFIQKEKRLTKTLQSVHTQTQTAGEEVGCDM